MNHTAGALELLGAGGFGVVVGWLLYFLNRYRTNEVRLEDLVTVIGAIGGGAVLALFPAKSQLFGAYGIGLSIGFFGYLATLMVLVRRSESFDWDWFLDGRHRGPRDDQMLGAARAPMESDDDRVLG